MKKRSFFQRLFGQNETPEALPLTPLEITKMADLWRSYGYRDIRLADDGIRVHTGLHSHLHIQKDKIVFHGEQEHASFRASVRHIQEAWGGSFVANGSDEFKLKSWAYAQVYGLTLADYQVPADKTAEAERLVLQVRALRDAEIRAANLPATTAPVAAASSEEDASPRDPALVAVPPSEYPSNVRPFRRQPDYVPPHNALTELLIKMPADVRAAVEGKLIEVRNEIPTGDWPHVPYHYGMGRIQAYEEWLGSLSKEDREREIAASRSRYEAHYQSQADSLASKMREAGLEIDPAAPKRETPEQIQEREARRARLMSRLVRDDKDGRDNDGPDRPQGPSRGGRGRSRGRER